MPKLNIATGVQEYDLNGECKIYFNPTDPNFIERVFGTFDDLDEKHEAYQKQIAEETDGKKVFEIARKLDADMRATLENALGSDVCTPLFGTMSVYAAADGLPLWANLLLSIIDEMDDAFAREKKATNPRIEKYTEKFKKR